MTTDKPDVAALIRDCDSLRANLILFNIPNPDSPRVREANIALMKAIRRALRAVEVRMRERAGEDEGEGGSGVRRGTDLQPRRKLRTRCSGMSLVG
jgi:hypothetical protein